jgi:flagella basal body P-ring formation protein FlgA
VRALILGVAAALLGATTALADPISLKANPTDNDGSVTLGDLFDGAGSAAGVVVGRRVGPSIVFEAGQLQGMARQAGLDWANPTGLRRVVVRGVNFAPGASAPAAADQGQPAVARTAAPVRAAYGDRVINRNDIVEVAYEAGGVRLTISGRAEGNAAEGQRIAIRNLQSNRVIDAVAIGPGLAVAGPGAQTIRTQQFASR